MKIRVSPNKIVKYLVLGDFVLWTSLGFVTPIFAVFIVDKIIGGTVVVAGIASSIYWLTRSLSMVPISVFLDAVPSEKDDFFTLIAGLFIVSIIPIGYIFATLPIHIYILQALYGIGMAMTLSGWRAIFTRHIDRGKEATEWSLDATSTGLGISAAGALGGWAVSKFGFNPVFLLVSVLSILSIVLFLSLRKEIRGVFEKDSLNYGVEAYLHEIFHRERK